MPQHHIHPKARAQQRREIGNHHRDAAQARGEPGERQKQRQHDERQPLRADVVHQIVGRIAERADADERQAGQGQQGGQHDDARHEVRDIITAIRILARVVVAQPHQALGGDQFGDGEVADDDDAHAGQHECGIEHGGGEGGAVAQLGEIVVIPVGIVGGQASRAHAGDDEERQQGSEGFRVHHPRLHERHVTDDAAETGADGRHIPRENRAAHYLVHGAEQREGR